MATPEEIRLERLRNDAVETRRLHGDVLRVTADGETPERYRLLVRVRSIMSPGPTYRGEHEVEVDLPSGYPWSKPQIKLLTLPPPFHPNWFLDGGWCGGTWDPEESLARHVLRMVKTLQFDPEVTNPSSPANREAADWYRRNLETGLFPCDRTPLPNFNRPRLQLQERRLELLASHDES